MKTALHKNWRKLLYCINYLNTCHNQRVNDGNMRESPGKDFYLQIMVNPRYYFLSLYRTRVLDTVKCKYLTFFNDQVFRISTVASERVKHVHVAPSPKYTFSILFYYLFYLFPLSWFQSCVCHLIFFGGPHLIYLLVVALLYPSL